MTNENGHSTQSPEEFINPLIERGRKIGRIQEQVDSIREWVFTGGKIVDDHDIIQYKKGLNKLHGTKRLKYDLMATGDPHAETLLRTSLSVSLEISDFNDLNQSQTVNLTFKYEDPRAKPVSRRQTHVFPHNGPTLYCHIFAIDRDSDDHLATEARPISELTNVELESVEGLLTGLYSHTKHQKEK